jgi:uridine kinase
MTQPPRAPTIVGIAGGTGSGKTTVANKIGEALGGRAIIIQHDWYYKDNAALAFDQRRRLNYDEPEALENGLLVEHLRALRSNETIECPQYDFSSHMRCEKTLRVEPHPVVVVEGILLFAVKELREHFDLCLYVDTDDDIRLMRRIKRDIVRRGRDIRSIQKQYYETVRPMHLLHVAPSKRFAHLIIPEGGENRHAVDVIVGRLKYLMAKATPS